VVTGGSGFVGSHVVEMLVAEGARVSVPTRRQSSPFLAEVVGEITIQVGDLEDSGFCRAVVDGAQVVLHLAAQVGGIQYNRVHHASLFHANLLPFLNTLDAARRGGVGRFLVTSSACVYPRDARVPTPEEDGIVDAPEPTNAGYGWSKRMEEYLGAESMAEFGMKVAIARPYNAYGPRDDFAPDTSHVIPGLIRKVLSGQDPLVVWGSGRQTRTFLYVEDLARGILRTAELYAEGSPVNIGTEQETSIRELVEHLLAITGRTPELVYDTSQPEGQPRRRCDTTKMREVLGWSPTTGLEDGLTATIDWFERARTPD
jgi:GDP-L-fucose synthase